MQQLPTKISKRATTHQSSTTSGQRELLRELRNKVNEIIDYLEQPDADNNESVEVNDTLYSFVQYCAKHPELRFWQALRNWSGQPAILVRKDDGLHDTYYWADKEANEAIRK